MTNFKFGLKENKPNVQITRDYEIEKFKQFMSNEKNILEFYGIGGIGKSVLKEQIINSIDTNKHVIFSVDFKIENHRSAYECLSSFAKISSNKKNHFFYFDIISEVYLSKKYPNYVLKGREKKVDKFGDAFDFISFFDNGIFRFFIDKIEFIANKIKLLNAPMEIRQDIKYLKNAKIGELEERLPAYFAKDIEKISKKYKPIFLISSFDMLTCTENESLAIIRIHKWFFDILEHLKNHKTIIFGRDMINLSQNIDLSIETYELQVFNDEQMDKYLHEANIHDILIQKHIKKSSKGHPLCLYLSVETYYKILKSGNKPKIDDLGINQEEIALKFSESLDQSEVQTLKMLSVTRNFDLDLYRTISKNQSNVLSVDSIENFFEYSFITKLEDKYFIHEIVRESILKNTSDIYIEEIHKLLISFYSKQLNKKFQVLPELIYHNAEIMDYNNFFNCFKEEYKDLLENLIKGGYQSIVLNTLNVIIEKYELRGLSLELVNMYIDMIHLGGEYEMAVELSESHLRDDRFAHDEHYLQLKVRTIHYKMFYQPVSNLLEESIMLRDSKVTNQYPQLHGELLYLIGGNLNFLKADMTSKKTLLYLKDCDAFAKENQFIDLQVRVARKKVDYYIYMKNFVEAKKVLLEVSSLQGESISKYHVYLMSSQAELFRHTKDYDNAIKKYNALLEEASSKKILGWEAHARLGLAVTYLSMDNQKRVTENVKQNLDIARKIYAEINQKWGQSVSDLVDVYIKHHENIDFETQLLNLEINLEELNYRYYKDVLKLIKENKNLDINVLVLFYL